MALPKLNTPTYELEVPSTDEKVKYRPFLVKEEKILLMALESGKNADIIQAVKDIVSECTFGKIDLGTMPMFDIEYIFLNIRAKSVGEISKLKLLCPDDKKTYVDTEINLSEVQVQVDEGHTNKIELGDGKTPSSIEINSHYYSKLFWSPMSTQNSIWTQFVPKVPHSIPLRGFVLQK